MNFLENIFFGDGKNLDTIAMVVRTAIIFIYGLFLIRIGKKRFFGKNTAFDFILSVIIGSILSRTVNGSAPFLPTLAAVASLVVLHWIASFFISRFSFVSNLLVGTPKKIISDGEVYKESILQSHLSEQDVMESVRLKGNVNSIKDIREGYLETNGEISVITK